MPCRSLPEACVVHQRRQDSRHYPVIGERPGEAGGAAAQLAGRPQPGRKLHPRIAPGNVQLPLREAPCLTQVRPAELGAGQVHLVEVDARQDRAIKLGAGEMCFMDVAPGSRGWGL